MVTDEQADQFHRDGAIVLRGVLDDEWIEVLTAGLDDAIERPDVMSENLGTLRVDQFPAARSPNLRRLVDDSPVAEMVGRTLRSSVCFYMDQLFHKPPGEVPPTPWHQDTCYYNVSGHQLIRAWIAPDPVPREFSLEVVRGSHLWNATYSPLAGRDARLDDEAAAMVRDADSTRPMLGADSYDDWTYWSGVRDHTLPPVPDIESNRDSFDILGWDYEPGDVLLFHGNILHGARGGGVSATTRRAHASLWAGEDVRYLHRIGQIIPDPVALYEHDPQTGQPLTDFPDVFPIAWAPR